MITVDFQHLKFDVKCFQDPFKIASNHKNEGNTCFKAGKYEEAIENYTKAINVCPNSKRQELSTFHQNKAAAYEKLVS